MVSRLRNNGQWRGWGVGGALLESHALDISFIGKTFLSCSTPHICIKLSLNDKNYYLIVIRPLKMVCIYTCLLIHIGIIILPISCWRPAQILSSKSVSHDYFKTFIPTIYMSHSQLTADHCLRVMIYVHKLIMYGNINKSNLQVHIFNLNQHTQLFYCNQSDAIC